MPRWRSRTVSRPASPSFPLVVHPLLRIEFRRLLKGPILAEGQDDAGHEPRGGAADAGGGGPAPGRSRAIRSRVPGARLTGRPIRTPMFGAVPVEDFVQFMAQHIRHHWRQLPRETRVV